MADNWLCQKKLPYFAMACAGDVKRHIDKNIAELVHLESYICYGFTPAALAAMPLAQTPNFSDFLIPMILFFLLYFIPSPWF